MTPEQRKQWNDYSCVPRCIIKLAEIRGKPVTDVDFAARFEVQIPEWQNRYGLTSVIDALKIVSDLQLAQQFLHLETVAKLQNHLANGQKLDHALVLTHKTRNTTNGALVELHHCRLLLGIQGTDIILQNPNQDGTEFPMKETFTSLAEQEAEFFILFA